MNLKGSLPSNFRLSTFAWHQYSVLNRILHPALQALNGVFLIATALSLAFAFEPGLAMAQTSGSGSSHLEVMKDPRLDVLVQKQENLNMLALHHVSGYRIQVISTMDRARALAAKAKLLSMFPSQECYLSYQSPYFRVRIGNFRKRSDAKALERQLEPYFPAGIFVVRDHVTITADQLLEEMSANGTH